MWDQMETAELDSAKTLNSYNPEIEFVHCQGIVSLIRSHHFEVLAMYHLLLHLRNEQDNN